MFRSALTLHDALPIFSCTAVPAPKRETLSAPAVYNNVPSISCSGFGMDNDGSERTHLFCFFKLIAPPAVVEAGVALKQIRVVGGVAVFINEYFSCHIFSLVIIPLIFGSLNAVTYIE